MIESPSENIVHIRLSQNGFTKIFNYYEIVSLCYLHPPTKIGHTVLGPVIQIGAIDAYSVGFPYIQGLVLSYTEGQRINVGPFCYSPGPILQSSLHIHANGSERRRERD